MAMSVKELHVYRGWHQQQRKYQIWKNIHARTSTQSLVPRNKEADVHVTELIKSFSSLHDNLTW